MPRGCTENLFSISFWEFKVRRERPIFDMDQKFEVLLGNAKLRESSVVPITESTRMRARCAKSHAIWCTEARERANFGFHGASVWRVAADAYMQRPSLRVLSRGDIRLTVCRGPEVLKFHEKCDFDVHGECFAHTSWHVARNATSRRLG